MIALAGLDLADRLQVIGAIGAIHGAAVDIDRGRDIVAARYVLVKLVEHVAPFGTVPKMVMGVDDALLGIDDVLHMEGEPFLARSRIAAAGRYVDAAFCHCLGFLSSFAGRRIDGFGAP